MVQNIGGYSRSYGAGEPSKWSAERRCESVYEAPVQGLPVESPSPQPGQPIPKRTATTRKPKRPGYIAPPKITGADEQEIASKRQKRTEAIRVTAGFLALRGQLTMDAAQHNLDQEVGPFICQEATTLALATDTPPAIIMRQRRKLTETAREMLDTLMDTPLGSDAATAADMPPSE